MICQITVFQYLKTQKTLVKLKMPILTRLYLKFWQNLLRVFMHSYLFNKFPKNLSYFLEQHCVLHTFKFTTQ